MLTKQTIPRHRADNEREYRDIIQGGMKLEEEMHALEPIKEEVLHLSSEKMELEALCKELSAKLEQTQFEKRQIPGMRAELQGLQEEIFRARVAYEAEKRSKVVLLEQRQTIERDFINMKIEAQRLQAELEKRRSGVLRHHAFGSYCNR
ncbi:hypothetical protein BS78_04G174500 [Paspalum vaginatum]|nr:hypothetical protein BS78_04G174500 [Paspalum vaginatum]